MHARSLGIYIYTLGELVEWLAEGLAGIRHNIQIEHVDFNLAYSARNQTSNSKCNSHAVTRDLGMQTSKKM